jgi:hypothetical protein
MRRAEDQLRAAQAKLGGLDDRLEKELEGPR